MTKDGFIERFGEIPRKDDITILAPKREDPTEQACVLTCCLDGVLSLEHT
jgi:DNA-directed RNA polymerase I, II, and III subunit RPABC1